MNASFDVDFYITQIYRLNEWLIAFPLPPEFRERTTYRQFHELMTAKQAELGLTPEVIAQLREVEDNEDLDWAWVEVGMTEDNRELKCDAYYEDLPLNFDWMPEYEPLQKAVENYMNSLPKSLDVEELDKVVSEFMRKHLAEFPISSK